MDDYVEWAVSYVVASTRHHKRRLMKQVHIHLLSEELGDVRTPIRHDGRYYT
jgi:hypothetical protein